MTTQGKQDGVSDVPGQVFESFLSALGTAGIPEEIVTRLRKALLHDKKFTDRALAEAIHPEDSQS